MSSATNTADLLDNVFSDEDLEDIANNAPVETGGGLDRDYELQIHNCYFQEASEEYQALMKKDKDGNKQKAIQIVFEGINRATGEERKEKFSIGQGFVLGDAEGKVAPRVVSTAGYTHFASSSLYGRIYRDLFLWGVPGFSSQFKEEDGRDDWSVELKTTDPDGKPKRTVAGPHYRAFATHVKTTYKKRPSAMEAADWVGCTLRMAKEEWEDKKTKKVRDRAFPVAILHIDGIGELSQEDGYVSEVAEVAQTAQTGKPAPSVPAAPAATTKPAVKAEPEKKEVVAPTEASKSEPLSDLEVLMKLREIAAASATKNAFQKEGMKLIQNSAEEAHRQKWLKVVVANFDDLKAGKGEMPDF